MKIVTTFVVCKRWRVNDPIDSIHELINCVDVAEQHTEQIKREACTDHKQHLALIGKIIEKQFLNDNKNTHACSLHA